MTRIHHRAYRLAVLAASLLAALSPRLARAARADSPSSWESQFGRRLRAAGVRRVACLGFGLNTYRYYDPLLADLAYPFQSDTMEAVLARLRGITVLSRSEANIRQAIARRAAGETGLVPPEEVEKLVRGRGVQAVVVGTPYNDTLLFVKTIHLDTGVPIYEMWLRYDLNAQSFRVLEPESVPQERRVEELRTLIPRLISLRRWREAGLADRALLELMPGDRQGRRWSAQIARRRRPDRASKLRAAIKQEIEDDMLPDAERHLRELATLPGEHAREIRRWRGRIIMRKDALTERLRVSVRRSMKAERWAEAGRDLSDLTVLQPDDKEVGLWRETIAARLRIRLNAERLAKRMSSGGPELGSERRKALKVRGGKKAVLHVEQLALPVARATPPSQRDRETIDVQAGRSRAMIYGCYALALAENPSLAGVLEVRFTILPTGAVTNVEIARSGLGNRALEECVAGIVSTWKFPPTTTTETFTHTFTFQPR